MLGGRRQWPKSTLQHPTNFSKGPNCLFLGKIEAHPKNGGMGQTSSAGLRFAGFFENASGSPASADNLRASAAWAKFLKRTPVILQILDN